MKEEGENLKKLLERK